MAIQLYREGTTHTVRGVECEVCNFTPREMDLRLSEGWVKDPSEIGSTTVETKPEELDNLHPVRVKAKEAGIEGWETKRIKTLEAELE